MIHIILDQELTEYVCKEEEDGLSPSQNSCWKRCCLLKLKHRKIGALPIWFVANCSSMLSFDSMKGVAIIPPLLLVKREKIGRLFYVHILKYLFIHIDVVPSSNFKEKERRKNGQICVKVKQTSGNKQLLNDEHLPYIHE